MKIDAVNGTLALLHESLNHKHLLKGVLNTLLTSMIMCQKFITNSISANVM